jgi:acyl-coenzyme A thioesterase 13
MTSQQPDPASNPGLEYFRSLIGHSFKDKSRSPFGRWLAGTLLAVEPGRLEIEFTVRPEMLNPAKTFHGGVIAGIMDDAIGATIFALGKKNFFTSVNLVVDYFAPAKEGDRVIAKTAIIKEGAKVINAQCEIWHAEKNRLLSRGTTNLMKIDVEVQ